MSTMSWFRIMRITPNIESRAFTISDFSTLLLSVYWLSKVYSDTSSSCWLA